MAFIIMNEIIQRSTPQAMVSRIIITASVNSNGFRVPAAVQGDPYAWACKMHMQDPS